MVGSFTSCQEAGVPRHTSLTAWFSVLVMASCVDSPYVRKHKVQVFLIDYPSTIPAQLTAAA